MKCYLIVVLIYISLLTNGVDHFICLLAVYLFGEMYILTFYCFLNWVALWFLNSKSFYKSLVRDIFRRCFLPSCGLSSVCWRFPLKDKGFKVWREVFSVCIDLSDISIPAVTFLGLLSAWSASLVHLLLYWIVFFKSDNLICLFIRLHEPLMVNVFV